MAYRAVQSFGMYGEDAGYISKDDSGLSDKHKGMVDHKVQQILRESKARVTALLQLKDRQVRDVAINLYKYDYLNQEEIQKIVDGRKLDKSNVREFDRKVAAYLPKL